MNKRCIIVHGLDHIYIYIGAQQQNIVSEQNK